MLPHLGITGKESEIVSQPVGESPQLRNVSSGWPQFRGPNRDGVAPTQKTEINWSKAPLLRWRVSAGEGHSSIITFGQSVITMEQDGTEELVIARSLKDCLLYTSPSPRDATLSRMPSSA